MTTFLDPLMNWAKVLLCGSSLLLTAGCGTTQQRVGTEQLLLSDAVDRTIDQLDFSLLSGRSVYLDTTYLRPVKGTLFVNADYIISALRHKLIVSGCAVRDQKPDAEYVVEARVGALGTDALEVTYGIPASNALTQAASLVASAPPLPSIPEISFGKRNSALSTSKIVAFAYHRETGQPVWQSGTSIAKSDARHTWMLGAGPLQRGSIYDQATFAGIAIGKAPEETTLKPVPGPRPGDVKMATAREFVTPRQMENIASRDDESTMNEDSVVPASHEAEN